MPELNDKGLSLCDWYGRDENEPCWGEIDSHLDSFWDPGVEGYGRTERVVFCSGHKNFANDDFESGYISEPLLNDENETPER